MIKGISTMFYDHRALICTMFVPGITEDCIVLLLLQNVAYFGAVINRHA